MASSNANTAGLLFVGVLALVLGRSVVSSPRPPTDQGPMRPPNRPRPPVLPGPPLSPPGPGDDLTPLQPLPADLRPGSGYNDPFSTATWSTSDQPAVGGNPGSMPVLEYDDPFIRKPRRDNVLGTYDVVIVAEQAPGDGEGNDPAPGPVAPGDPGLDPGGDPGLQPGGDPGLQPGGDPGMVAGNIGGALQP